MSSLYQYYQSTEAHLWQGRQDSLAEERFFQQIQLHNLNERTLEQAQGKIALLGFASDEGVRRNEGRVGAALGPVEIRKRLARLACHKKIELIDIGDIHCVDGDLEHAQIAFGQMIDHAHQQGLKTLAFGGGHEIAWAHYLGLWEHYPKLGVINIDAHFDLRPLKKGYLASSGTGFWQMLQHCQSQKRAFEYTVLGIQASANTKSLYQTADQAQVNYLSADEIQKQSRSQLDNYLDKVLIKSEQIYLTICMDVFAESVAPGVSAPQALGLYPNTLIPLLTHILNSGKVIAIDFAEYAPRLDRDGQTARLCAELCAKLIHQWC